MAVPETTEAGARFAPFAVLSFQARIAEVCQRRLGAALDGYVAATDAANRAWIEAARPLTLLEAWGEAVGY